MGIVGEELGWWGLLGDGDCWGGADCWGVGIVGEELRW